MQKHKYSISFDKHVQNGSQLIVRDDNLGFNMRVQAF